MFTLTVFHAGDQHDFTGSYQDLEDILTEAFGEVVSMSGYEVGTVYEMSSGAEAYITTDTVSGGSHEQEATERETEREVWYPIFTTDHAREALEDGIDAETVRRHLNANTHLMPEVIDAWLRKEVANY